MQVSSLCMGTMTFGREADEAVCGLIYKRCRDLGINFFDSANIYAEGQSEEILGRLIRGCRDEVIITSKFFGKMGPDINSRGCSRRNLMISIEASLRRLQTDRIELYYIHSFDHTVAMEETLCGLDDLVRQGKILYPAVTAPIIGARNMEQLEAALASWEVKMTPALRAEISALSRTPPLATDRRDEQVGLWAH